MTGRSEGFAPIAGPGIHTLLLGTLPSRRSLETGQYYGHPRNAFWPIMGRLFDAGTAVDYEDRCRRLLASGIGVWDVLRSSLRPGSLDASIDTSTAEVNDFQAFLTPHDAVGRIFFNGLTAATLYRRRVEPTLDLPKREIACATLPSTSPAHAAMGFDDKLNRWSAIANVTKAVR